MMIMNNILERVGGTPVLKLTNLLPPDAAALYVKLEGYNPGGSVKDRPALSMIEAAERAGLLCEGGTVVESTSGNLGVALAMVCAIRGYKCVIVVDPRTSSYNMTMIEALGGTINMVHRANPVDSTYQDARIQRAKHLAKTIPGAYMPWQYGNPSNPAAHTRATAAEIMTDFKGGPTEVVAAVSTAGQICGISKGLRERGSGTRVIGVDVSGSIVFGGRKKPTFVTGMGLGWIPENLDETLIDEAYLVETEQCFRTARALSKQFGILFGGSTGASLFVAIARALQLPKSAGVLAISADRGEKYLDEFFNNDWMSARQLPIDDSIDTVLADARSLEPFRSPAREAVGCARSVA